MRDPGEIDTPTFPAGRTKHPVDGDRRRVGNPQLRIAVLPRHLAGLVEVAGLVQVKRRLGHRLSVSGLWSGLWVVIDHDDAFDDQDDASDSVATTAICRREMVGAEGIEPPTYSV